MKIFNSSSVLLSDSKQVIFMQLFLWPNQNLNLKNIHTVFAYSWVATGKCQLLVQYRLMIWGFIWIHLSSHWHRGDNITLLVWDVGYFLFGTLELAEILFLFGTTDALVRQGTRQIPCHVDKTFSNFVKSQIQNLCYSSLSACWVPTDLARIHGFFHSLLL